MKAPARAVIARAESEGLRTILSNLIENAIRYGASGGEIVVAVRPADRKVRIEVADRGPGIPSDLRGEALRRFGRLDSSRSDEGAGLGLALAEAIAHLHDGELLLEDNAPGLRIAIELPLRGDREAGASPVSLR